ncbi:unnamed protein product, partial [Ectocarpus sp. 12 AP-2014]
DKTSAPAPSSEPSETDSDDDTVHPGDPLSPSNRCAPLRTGRPRAHATTSSESTTRNGNRFCARSRRWSTSCETFRGKTLGRLPTRVYFSACSSHS